MKDRLNLKNGTKPENGHSRCHGCGSRVEEPLIPLWDSKTGKLLGKFCKGCIHNKIKRMVDGE